MDKKKPKNPFIQELKKITGHNRQSLAEILMVSEGLVKQLELAPDVHGAKSLQPGLVGMFGLREGLCDPSNVLEFVGRFRANADEWLDSLWDCYGLELHEESENKMGKPLPCWVGELGDLQPCENDPSYVDVELIAERTGRIRKSITNAFQGLIPVIKTFEPGSARARFLVRKRLLEILAEQYNQGLKYRMLLKNG